jgi:class 3 adenylate cyclase
VAGIAINIAARVQATASTGQVLVSDTVRDLMLGSAVHFEHAGTHELRGLASTRQLYSVMSV